MSMLATAIAADSKSTTPKPPAHRASAPRQSESRPHALKSSSAAAYAKDLRQYQEGFGGRIPCSRAMLERYIASLRAVVAPTTIHRRVMALRNEHIRLGHPSPTDEPALRPILRRLQLGFVPGKTGSVNAPKKKEPRQARPITRALLAKMLDAMGTDSLDRRDRCLLLLGFASMLSRSILVSLDVADIRFTNDVMALHLRQAGGLATAEQSRPPRIVTVPITGHELCAATATRAWIAHAALDIEGGPLIRRFDRAGNPTADRLDGAWVSVVVKNRLRAVGIDPTHFSALSLRRGRLSEMAKGTL
jgi:integrase